MSSKSGLADPGSPTVSLASVRPLLAVVEANGLDLADTPVGRWLASGRDTGGEIRLVDYFRIERDIAQALDDLTAHMSTRRLTYETGAFVINQIKSSQTLSEVIDGLAAYFNMMHGGAYNKVHRTDQSITLEIDDREFPYSMREDRQSVCFMGECVQIKVHCLLDSLSHGLAAQALQAVDIVRADGMDAAPHLEYWPRRPRTGRPDYKLSYDLRIANQSIPPPKTIDLSADGIFSRVIQHLEQTASTHRKMRYSERARELIAEGEWRQDVVARAVGVSVATLRRRLAEEQTSFRALVAESRLKRAEMLLNRGLTVQQVADALDYSDMRAFIRAFQREKGVTPTAFRRVPDEAV